LTSWETGRMGGGASKNRPVSAAPKTNTDVAKKLGKAFDDGGIKKVILIRHANAKPRDPDAAAVEAGTVLKADTPHANAWTVGDLTRGITEKGEQQAKASRRPIWMVCRSRLSSAPRQSARLQRRIS